MASVARAEAKEVGPVTASGKIGMLDGISVESGVSADTGVGFCTVRATAESGDVFVGQLDVETVRRMALDWLGAAEAAESDSIVMAELVETIGLDVEHAARFIVALRNRRQP